MREYWILSKLQLSSLYGINQLRHTRTPKERKKAGKSLLLFGVMALSFGYLSVLYSLILANVLQQSGTLSLLPGLIAFATALLVLLFTLFETKGVLFGFGDYDTVMSWPVSVTAVAASRVTALIAYNLIYVVLLMGPAGVVYGIYASAAWWFYPLYFALMLFVPALPTVLGACVGTLIALLTAGIKKRGAFGAAFQIMFALLIMLLSMQLNSGMSALATNASLLGGALCAYPPARWFGASVTGAPGGVMDALLFVLSAIAAILLFAFLLGRSFVRLNTRLSAVPHRRAYRMERLRRSGHVRALYSMEWRRYTSSALYLSNTAIGWAMLLIAAVAIGIFRPIAVMQALESAELAGVRTALPLLLGWLALMSATTASAISIEGRRLWIVKSLPVPARDWLLAKLLVSLTPAIPSLIVSTVLLGLGLRASATECLWLFVLPLCFSVFSGVLGLWLNLCLPKLDWKTEAEAVKQSMAVMIQVFASMAVIGLPSVLLIVTNAVWILPLTAACALLTAALVWARLLRTADRRLYRL